MAVLSSLRCTGVGGWREVRDGCGSILWVPNRCRVCPGCSEHHKAIVKGKIRYGLATTEERAFLTLTCHPDTPQAHDLAALGRSWSKMLRWLRTRTGVHLEACRVVETTKAGAFHLHIGLIGWKFIPQREISDAWRRFSGSPIVHIEAIDVKYGPAYLAKYVSKNVADSDIRQRVSFTRGWPRETREAGSWRVTGVETGSNVPAAVRGYTVGGCGVGYVAESCKHVPPWTPSDWSDVLYERRLVVTVGGVMQERRRSPS